MRRLLELIGRVSSGRYPVLIEGESGTGKGLVALAIHESGPRAHLPFVPVDCGALVPGLIESELFGHVRGAFTGAEDARDGLLMAAGAGTVFFDEIGELPRDLQVKLLRVLQEKEIRPVGSTRSVRFEARVLAATNCDLGMAVREGRFRKDLYFRVNVVALQVPPLRLRKADIPDLVHHFLGEFQEQGRSQIRLAEGAIQKLMEDDWPGNVRELEHCIQRAVALRSGSVIESSDLFAGARSPAVCTLDLSSAIDSCVSLRELERLAILRALSDADGDKIAAARMLEIGKTTLYRKLKEYGSSR